MAKFQRGPIIACYFRLSSAVPISSPSRSAASRRSSTGSIKFYGNSHKLGDQMSSITRIEHNKIVEVLKNARATIAALGSPTDAVQQAQLAEIDEPTICSCTASRTSVARR